MRNISKMFLLCAGIILSLAGCQKGTTPANLTGKSVRFSAAAGSIDTRTSFSGDGTQTTAATKTDLFGRKILTWERINWEKDDAILIASDNATVYNDPKTHYATYTVASVNEAGDISEAELNEKIGSEELFFTGADSYTFWGIYPAPADAATAGPALLEDKASFTINAAQTLIAPAEDVDPIVVTDNEVTKTLTTLSSDMKQAVMLAKAVNQTEEKVEMEFYPAFTAFEFTLNSLTSDIILKELVLKNAAGNNIAGSVAATIVAGGQSTFMNTPSDDALTITFPENTKITKNDYVTFTVFALPEDIEGLYLEFHLGENGEEIQKATLKQTVNGVKQDITFGKCKKHNLRGVAVKGGWNFTYLTLDIQPLDWVPVNSTISSGDGVQATQFSMSFNDGADTDDHCLRYVKQPNDKDYRQCWVFKPTFTTGEGDDATTETTVVTVKYKIMMPASTDGTWSIEKCGDTNDFTVEVTSTSGETTTSGNTYSGSLSTGATYLTITIKSTATTLKFLYFKTYVSDGTSTFSLDSETQLYDMRGYHYFIVNGNAATTFDDLTI